MSYPGKQNYPRRVEGTYCFLKNFRKGLNQQGDRARHNLEAAAATSDKWAVSEAQHRLEWIQFKQWQLDKNNEMIKDKPSIREYASMDADTRWTTWNSRMQQPSFEADNMAVTAGCNSQSGRDITFT